jgi:hypothetical protein
MASSCFCCASGTSILLFLNGDLLSSCVCVNVLTITY